MRAKTLVLLIVLSVALTAIAQTATQAPPPDAKAVNACACCSHSNASGDTGKCCDKGCCKDGKCPMMSEGSAGPRCPMMAKEGKSSGGKMCCAGDKCPMHGNGGHAGNCCCGHMMNHDNPGM